MVRVFNHGANKKQCAFLRVLFFLIKKLRPAAKVGIKMMEKSVSL